jgi:predicted phage terminase large subunit-like protein
MERVCGSFFMFKRRFMASVRQLLTAYKKFKKADMQSQAFACLYNMYALDKEFTYPHLVKFRTDLTARVNAGENPQEFMQLLKKAYLLSAADKFDDYCIYIEWDRENKKRFYLPRRKQLLPVVQSLQDQFEDKLDVLGISMPPGTGKTTLAIFYLTFVGGNFPNEPILGGSHSNSFLHGVYEEILRIIQGDGEYLWHDVFPAVKLTSTNAKDMRIDLDKPQRFETFEFSSVGSGNAGKVRAKRLLYCDDLVDGIETAMSKERLDKLWQMYYTDLRQRKIGNCKELHIATRWSVHDVIGRLERQYSGNPRARFLVFPALDENDESLFDYPFGVGFTTEFYHEQRDIMDDASWKALYMNEPIEREGLLYHADELRRYFELPDREPDAILSVCDTKDKGTDYCAMPIAYQYGNDFYIDKFICDNGNPEIVEARIVAELVSRKVKMSRFESNSAGGKIAESVQKAVKENGGITKITTKYSTANKDTRIIVDSPWVKEHCLFKDESLYKADKEYRTAMNFLCGYTMAGKNKNDDIPDSMSMLANFIESLEGNVVTIIKRPF